MTDSTASTPAPDPSATALNGQGMAAYTARSYIEAARLFRKAADMGYAPAQYNLGYCYKYGDGVPRDLTLSAEWYRKAAEQGIGVIPEESEGA